jgi:hypothetical protein
MNLEEAQKVFKNPGINRQIDYWFECKGFIEGYEQGVRDAALVIKATQGRQSKGIAEILKLLDEVKK